VGAVLFTNERILILGAGGQDGTLIRKNLKNSKIVSISRGVLGNLGNSEDVHIQIKQYNTPELTEIITKYRPKYILNFGGLSSVAECEGQPQQSFEMNYLQVTKVVAAINRAKLKDFTFMQCSSSEIFGEGILRCNESRQINPITVYGKHKAQAMDFLKSTIYDNLLNLILFNHESEYRSEKFVSKKIINGILNYQKTGEQISIGNVNSGRDWSYAPDFVLGMVNLLRSNKIGDYVFGSGTSHTVMEFALLVMKFSKIQLGFNELFKIDNSFFRKVETPALLADSSKYIQEFSNLNNYTFEEMVEIMFLRTGR
jgi:GDPmannose 4,6-dehydratase